LRYVMKMLVDLNHPVDVNFFKNAIRLLTKQHDFNIEITVQPRGKLVPILQRELPDYHFTPIGMHRKSMAAKVIWITFRFPRFFDHVRRGKYDVVASFGGTLVCHATYILRKPSVIFDDDIEFGLGFYPYKPFATRLVMPQQIPVRGKNIVRYRGFKELAYLHPNHFQPCEHALEEYGIRAEEYVFVREVSKISANYAHMKTGGLADTCSRLRTLGLKVILSLEDKSLTDLFAPNCIILKEPVGDIYSLMHFARLTISSGDTMARESCLTGTPVIYTGGRYMSVNTELVKKGIFFEPDSDHTVMDLVSMICKMRIKEKTGETVKQALLNEWEDTTEVIVRNVLEAVQPNPPARTSSDAV
jgi:predicted glycosyltransferase